MTDIIVVGGGPAGMTAALYARRNNKTVLVLEKNGFTLVNSNVGEDWGFETPTAADKWIL